MGGSEAGTDGGRDGRGRGGRNGGTDEEMEGWMDRRTEGWKGGKLGTGIEGRSGGKKITRVGERRHLKGVETRMKGERRESIVPLYPGKCTSHTMMRLIFSPSGFGLASHLGVLSGIPCIGVGKQLFHVDGLTKGAAHREKVGVIKVFANHHYFDHPPR